jgi:hypothetical protein
MDLRTGIIPLHYKKPASPPFLHGPPAAPATAGRSPPSLRARLDLLLEFDMANQMYYNENIVTENRRFVKRRIGGGAR